MIISSIEIKYFVFLEGELSLSFCSGINILTGVNGTGKTTILNAINSINSREDLELESLDVHYDKNGTFSSGVENYKYVRPPICHFQVNLKNGTSCKMISFPVAEMLSHSKGLLPLTTQLKMPFTKAEIDILAKAQLPETIEITPNAAKVLDKIKDLIGGEVTYKDDEFFVKKEAEEEVPFSLEASGFRKFGLLWKLLRNGLLESGTVLLWDEPENSLNPELLPALADILLELSRNGVQIFIATHSELLSRCFAVCRQREKGDKVKFFSLYKKDGRIQADSDERFDLLEPNSLTNAEVIVYDKEVEVGLGGN